MPTRRKWLQVYPSKNMDVENHTERILLVDDTPATIAVIKTILEEQGYEVFVATT
jgi:PleD family two-component response regulator